MSASSTAGPSYNLKSAKKIVSSRTPTEVSATKVQPDEPSGDPSPSSGQNIQTTYLDRNTPLELLSDLSNVSDDSDEEWENGSNDSDDTSVDHDRGGEEDDDDGWLNDSESLLEDELRYLVKEYVTSM